jgi:sugar/nucleoside kinase (ribokinase family)
VHAIIVVDESRHTRNIFYDLDGVIGADPRLPEPEVIRSAGVLFVDHIGIDGAIRAARIAHQAEIPVVADLESNQSPRFAELLVIVDHLVISRDFAQAITGKSDPAAAVEALGGQERKAVVVTCGPDGCWYSNGSPGDRPRHQRAFEVKVVDTTGCGDVFHGAYAAALARGMPLEERIRVAAAAAAIKATRPGGQAGIPTWSVVESFLRGT